MAKLKAAEEARIAAKEKAERCKNLHGGYRVIIKKKPWGNGEGMHFDGTTYKRDWAAFPQMPELYYLPENGVEGREVDWRPHWAHMPGPEGVHIIESTGKEHNVWHERAKFRSAQEAGRSGKKGGPGLNSKDLGNWTQILDSADKGRKKWANRWGDGHEETVAAHWGGALPPASCLMGNDRPRVVRSSKGRLHPQADFNGLLAGPQPEEINTVGGSTFVRMPGGKSPIRMQKQVFGHTVGFQDANREHAPLRQTKDGTWTSTAMPPPPLSEKEHQREQYRRGANMSAELALCETGFVPNDKRRQTAAYQAMRKKDMPLMTKEYLSAAPASQHDSDMNLGATLNTMFSDSRPSPCSMAARCNLLQSDKREGNAQGPTGGLYYYMKEGQSPPQQEDKQKDISQLKREQLEETRHSLNYALEGVDQKLKEMERDNARDREVTALLRNTAKLCPPAEAEEADELPPPVSIVPLSNSTIVEQQLDAREKKKARKAQARNDRSCTAVAGLRAAAMKAPRAVKTAAGALTVGPDEGWVDWGGAMLPTVMADNWALPAAGSTESHLFNTMPKAKLPVRAPLSPPRTAKAPLRAASVPLKDPGHQRTTQKRAYSRWSDRRGVGMANRTKPVDLRPSPRFHKKPFDSRLQLITQHTPQRP